MIYVECDADSALVRSITSLPKREIAHERGKYRVLNRLAKKRDCKGLVDEDPGTVEPLYFKRARLQDDLTEHQLKVLYDSSNNNRLIILCPKLEDWILKAAKEAGKDVKKYGLPDDVARLHRLINLRLDEFENLLQALVSCRRLRTLRDLLKG